MTHPLAFLGMNLSLFGEAEKFGGQVSLLGEGQI